MLAAGENTSTLILPTGACAKLNIHFDKTRISWESPQKEADAMADKQAIFYPHRLNRDGSFDSICLTCFATVVYAKTEAELVDSDKDHVCDSGFLAERGCYVNPHSISGGRFSTELPPLGLTSRR
jgi:hypothetical protein